MAKSPEQSSRTTEYDEAGDFLAQFLASNPQNPVIVAPPPVEQAVPVSFSAPSNFAPPPVASTFAPPPPAPTFAPPPPPAPAGDSEGISLADLLPDIFNEAAMAAEPAQPNPFDILPPLNIPTDSQPGQFAPLPGPFDSGPGLAPSGQPLFEVEPSPKERKRQEKQAKLQQKQQAKLAKREEKQQAKLAKIQQQGQEKQAKLLPQEEQRLAKIQQAALEEQAKLRQKEEARQAKAAELQQKAREKQAKLEQKEAYQRAKLSKEQKAQQKQAQLEQKAREKEALKEQKAQEKQLRSEQKAREKELSQQEKQALKAQQEQDKLLKQELKEREKLARLGLLPDEGEELNEEQQRKLEALKSMGGGNSNLPIFIAIAIALFMVAGFMVLTLLLPPDITLDDLKAPDNSAKFEFSSTAKDNIKKAIGDAKQMDAKALKKVQIDMLAATNTSQSPAQIYDYFNNSLKGKDNIAPVPAQAVDETIMQALVPRGVGPVVKRGIWHKGPGTDQLIVMIVPLGGNGGAVAAINNMVQGTNGPVTPAGNLIIMAKLTIAQG